MASQIASDNQGTTSGSDITRRNINLQVILGLIIQPAQYLLREPGQPEKKTPQYGDILVEIGVRA